MNINDMSRLASPDVKTKFVRYNVENGKIVGVSFQVEVTQTIRYSFASDAITNESNPEAMNNFYNELRSYFEKKKR